MNTNLPNDFQKEKVAEMIQAAFVEIRIIGIDGKGKQASDLADAFHNISREIYGWGCWDPAVFRGMLQDYQTKYHEGDYLGKRDYLYMFDQIFTI